MKKQSKKPQQRKSFGRVSNPIRMIPTNVKLEQIVRAFLMAQTSNFEPTVHVPTSAMNELHTVAVGQYHRGYQEFQATPEQVTACALAGASATKILEGLKYCRRDIDGVTVPVLTTEEFNQESPVVIQAQSTLGAVWHVVRNLYL